MEGDYGPAPQIKPFVKKNPELDTLDDYSGTFPNEYWEKWTKSLPTGKAVSWINMSKLSEIAKQIGYESEKLDLLRKWCEEGAKLGVTKPDARLPSEGKNSKQAFIYGDRVSDSLQSGIKKGYIYGPIRREELSSFGILNPKFLPLSCRLKPNGTARLIIDASSPHFDFYNQPPPGTPRAVNWGIDIRNYPSRMSTFRDINEILMEAGAGSRFMKLDWTR